MEKTTGRAVFPESYVRDTLLRQTTQDIAQLLNTQDMRDRWRAVARLDSLVEVSPDPALLAFRGHCYTLIGRRDLAIVDCERAIRNALPTEAAVRLYAHAYEGIALAESGDSPVAKGDPALRKRLYRQALGHYDAAVADDLADVPMAMNIQYLRERVRGPLGEPERAVAMASPPWQAIFIFSAGVTWALP